MCVGSPKPISLRQVQIPHTSTLENTATKFKQPKNNIKINVQQIPNTCGITWKENERNMEKYTLLTVLIINIFLLLEC